jgi:hypothetical protein
MLSAHIPTSTPEALLDHEKIRQKRFKKFLLNCAKGGVKTPLPLNVAKQNNATSATMMEVDEECDAIGIPSPDRPYATASLLSLPPTPKTGATNCIWDGSSNEETLTPNIPEDDGNSPNFPEVLWSFLTGTQDRKDYYTDDEIDYYIDELD